MAARTTDREIGNSTVFVTGATGYIGGSIATALVEEGATVRGLSRSDAGVETLEEMGVNPVRGSLSDWSVLKEEARQADMVINAADADDAYAVDALLAGLEGSGDTLIHTSGSSVVGDKAAGEYDGAIYTEDSYIRPGFEKAGRAAIEQEVIAASARDVRSIVICPSLIYGEGLGPKKESIQLPLLIELAEESGVARHVGPGENIWSHVHIEDLVDLYLRALENAPAGSFFFAEQGEARMSDLASAIGRMLGLGERTEPIGLEDAVARWGPAYAHYTFGSNSRVSAEKARKMLDWSPQHPGLLEMLADGWNPGSK